MAAHELILGGQRSGKSRCAERRAAAWLAQPGHSALLLATALGGDDEMRARINRHRQDRAERVPALVKRLIAAGAIRITPPEMQWKVSPATGLVLKELLLCQKLTVPLEPFRLERVPCAARPQARVPQSARRPPGSRLSRRVR